jgi:hypothetical protein
MFRPIAAIVRFSSESVIVVISDENLMMAAIG